MTNKYNKIQAILKIKPMDYQSKQIVINVFKFKFGIVRQWMQQTIYK